MQIEQDRRRCVAKLRHEYGVELMAIKQGTAPGSIPKEGYAADFLTEERNFDLMRGQADLFPFLNVMLLTLTPLQWAGGDRIANRFLIRGEQLC